MKKFKLSEILNFKDVKNSHSNEHIAKIKDTDDFKDVPQWSASGRFCRTNGGNAILSGENKTEVPENVGIIWGQLKDQEGETAAVQSLRFPKNTWTEDSAKAWLEENKIEAVSFEAVKSKSQKKKELKYFNKVEDGSNEYEILFNGWTDEQCLWIAEEIQWINEWNESTKIIIHINNDGGYITLGTALIAAIENSKIPVETRNEGTAASMGAMVLVSGNTRKAFDFALTMIHSASYNGIPYEQLTPQQKEAIDAYNHQLKTILKNKTKANDETIDQWLSKDTWFTAEEAKEHGIIDEVISTEKKNLLELPIQQRLVAMGKNFNINNNKNKTEMKEIAKKLGLSENATEQEILDKLIVLENEKTELQNNLETAQNSLKEAQAKVEAFEAKAKEAEEAEAEQIVEDAIKENKIDASKKEEIVAKAKADLEGFKAILGSMKASGAPKVTEHLDANFDSMKTYGVKAEDFTFANLEKNNPSVLAKVRTENAALYAKLEKEYIAEGEKLTTK